MRPKPKIEYEELRRRARIHGLDPRQPASVLLRKLGLDDEYEA